MTGQTASDRLARLEAATSTLRHDIRGLLSPALLVADRLQEHADPAVARAAARIVEAIERVEARLLETKG